MLTLSDITLIIPTHNRHGYLRRILDYYSNVSIQIIVADSTVRLFDGHIDRDEILYCHYPNMPMPQKIRKALEQVNTTYVVMCADDDFIIPEGMAACIDFLHRNPAFIAAQGNNISYKKQSNYSKYVELNPMYLQQLNFEITDNDAFERMRKLFQPYRTIFSAVHYTEILKKGFEKLNPEIRNLYLNEYLTAIVPILSGSYKELNLFYQVREFSLTSDDKTTDNLDLILTSTKYKKELNVYLNYLSQIASEISGKAVVNCRENIFKILETFAENIRLDKQQMYKISLSKRIGNVVQKLPVLGKKIVMSRRLKTQKIALTHVIKTPAEMQQLDRVKKCIISYASVVI